MSISRTDNICADICRALGLDPNLMKMVNIHMAANRIVTITTKAYLESEDGKALIPVLKKYRLVDK